MKYGPLQALPNGIAIAEPAGRHFLLTAEGLHHQRGDERLASFRWEELSAVVLDLRGSWFRHPGTLAKLGLALVAFVAQQVDVSEADVDYARITLRDGSVHELPLDRELGGYWRRAVSDAERLVAEFVESEVARGLLEHPQEVLKRLTAGRR